MDKYFELAPHLIAEYPLDTPLYGIGFFVPGIFNLVGSRVLEIVGPPPDFEPFFSSLWDASLEVDSEYVKLLGKSLYDTGIEEFRTEGFINGMNLIGDVWYPNTPVPPDVDFYNAQFDRVEFEGNTTSDVFNYINYETDIQWIEKMINCIVKRLYNKFGENILVQNVLTSIDLIRPVFQQFFDRYGEALIYGDDASNISKAILKIVYPNNARIHEEVLLKFGEYAPQLRDEDFVRGVMKLHDMLMDEVDEITLT